MNDFTEVTAAVIVRGGRVLLVRRGPGERHAGFWEFPGGKMRPKETQQSCLERELREELGLEAAAGEVIAVSEHAYDHASIRLTAMLVRIGDGEPSLVCHDRAEWVAPEELRGYRLSPADLPIAERVRELLGGGGGS